MLAGSASELDISSCALPGRYALGFAVICGAGLASLRTVLAEFFSPEDPLVQVRARSHLHTKFHKRTIVAAGLGFSHRRRRCSQKLIENAIVPVATCAPPRTARPCWLPLEGVARLSLCCADYCLESLKYGLWAVLEGQARVRVATFSLVAGHWLVSVPLGFFMLRHYLREHCVEDMGSTRCKSSGGLSIARSRNGPLGSSDGQTHPNCYS